MDSFELNKIVGAVLGVLLLVMGTGLLAEGIFAGPKVKVEGYELPVAAAVSAAPAAEAKAADTPIVERLKVADAKRGETGVKACQACHNFEKGAAAKVGPALYGVVDRAMGSMTGFNYSAGFKERSAKGDKFRRFAQGLTLDHLVYLANRQLSRLHGRYQLRRKAEGELELEIVDSWQADVSRDTRTLSGGESFLVSLALALALSDLVSHKTSIDSLFLDEGFGTLDAETLEIALDALDSLNASGKMIGVISHVEGMKERIAVQIRVARAGGVGLSALSVVGG